MPEHEVWCQSKLGDFAFACTCQRITIDWHLSYNGPALRETFTHDEARMVAGLYESQGIRALTAQEGNNGPWRVLILGEQPLNAG